MHNFSNFTRGVIGVPSDALEVQVSAIPSGMNYIFTEASISEQIGIARYRLYSALGWNAPE